MIRSMPHTSRRRFLASVATVVLAALGLGELLQDFTGPSAAWAALIPASVYARTTSGDAGDVDLVLRLARDTDPQPAALTRLLATRPNDMNAGHALVWFHALSHSSTHRAMDANTLVYDLAEHPDDISLGVEIVELTLEQPDRRVVVTDSGLAEAARTSLSREQADRLQLEQ